LKKFQRYEVKMKVIHILKTLEMIDRDIKDLRKLEKSIKRNKAFTTPIYMSIEKQINILLGDRIKMLELRIENPPKNLVEMIEGKVDVEADQAPESKPTAEKKGKARKSGPKQEATAIDDEDDDEEIPILTQTGIDEKIKAIEGDNTKDKRMSYKKVSRDDDETDDEAESVKDDESVKLLDIALEKGSLNKEDLSKEKKKVRFFKDNFPGGEY
jgi:hypothetical protein